MDDHYDNVINMFWEINYWGMFTLNWFILPFLLEFVIAVDFSIKERVIRSLKNNFPYLLIYIFLFALIVVILALTAKQALTR